jgi:hypothetical protein
VELLSVEPVSLGFRAATMVTVELEDSAMPACVVEMRVVDVPAADE